MLNEFKKGLINLSRNNILMVIIGINILNILIVAIIGIVEYEMKMALIALFFALLITSFHNLLIYLSKQSEEFIQKNTLINIVLSSYLVVLPLMYGVFVIPNVWVFMKITSHIDSSKFIQILICWILLANIISIYLSYNFKKYLSK